MPELAAQSGGTVAVVAPVLRGRSPRTSLKIDVDRLGVVALGATARLLELLGALHVPTLGEARGDAEAFHFTWWPTGLQPSAMVCDPFVSVEAFGGAFAGAAARREEAAHRQPWCSTAATPRVRGVDLDGTSSTRVEERSAASARVEERPSKFVVLPQLS